MKMRTNEIVTFKEVTPSYENINFLSNFWPRLIEENIQHVVKITLRENRFPLFETHRNVLETM